MAAAQDSAEQCDAPKDGNRRDVSSEERDSVSNEDDLPPKDKTDESAARESTSAEVSDNDGKESSAPPENGSEQSKETENGSAEKKDTSSGDDGSHTSPPVHEISVDGSTSQESHGSGFSPIRSIKLLVYVVIAWVGLLYVVISLERAGVTENLTDVRLEEFLARTRWASNHNISSYSSPQSQRVGYKLAQEGASAKYPIVMIPGFVTSGLELWAGKPCARNKYFRQRMWGGIGTARQFFTERDCWREHLALDPVTGMDPDGIKLRSCAGFEAADFFMANYWVWSKLIENLADLGYDASSMSMMSYDWRLSYPLVEKRDGYFTKLKYQIEAMHKTAGKKVVIAAHSMGSPLMVYFFTWVTKDEKDGGGGGGSDWVDQHVHAFVNIAGPMLGVIKAAPALLSGEMRDTSLFAGVFGSMIEEFFGRRLRKDLWNTWGSLWAMLPRGGDAVWGVGADMCNSSSANDGLFCTAAESGESTASVPLIQLTDTEPLGKRDKKFHCDGTKKERRQASYLSRMIDDFSSQTNHTVEDTLLFLSKWGAGHGPSYANAKHNSLDEDDKPSSRTWSDPSRTPLPDAPKLKIYCLYGVGLRTERAYFFKRNTADAKPSSEDEPRMCNNSHFDPPLIMNSSVEDTDSDISYGVKFSDGDGSVPLLSLGYLCVDTWKRKDLNPSGSMVMTREYPNSEEFHMGDPMRGGPHAADHVDILGNVDMTEDFLRIVSDHGIKKLKPRIVSDLMNITERINAHPNGGLYVPKKKTGPIEAIRSVFDKK